MIRGNTIGKKLAWFGQAIGVKNVLELKNAKRVLIEKNDFCCSWTQGQVGFGLTLTVRNQDGGAPWSTIQDVTIRNNTWRDIASAIAILGRDDIKETREGRDVPIGTVRRSVPMARVTISGDTFALDPVKYGKGNINSKAIQIGGGPIALTIENVTITSASRVGAVLSFPAGPIVDGFKFINVTVPASSLWTVRRRLDGGGNQLDGNEPHLGEVCAGRHDRERHSSVNERAENSPYGPA